MWLAWHAVVERRGAGGYSAAGLPLLRFYANGASTGILCGLALNRDHRTVSGISLGGCEAGIADDAPHVLFGCFVG